MLVIPGYQIIEHLYSGTVSQVYRARCERDERPVMLKVCTHDPALPERLAWFQREYNLTRSLDLAGVVRAYELEIVQQYVVMVLEDSGSDTLARLGLAGTLSLIDFLKLAIELTDALAQLHARQIIHKDINPTNILYDPASGQVKLIDLGLATELTHEMPVPCAAELVQGTLPYVSPEQTGHTQYVLDYRTDLYSLGVTLYELLAGRLPFDSAHAEELIACHIGQQPAPLHAHKPGIPPIFSDIILKLMAKEPHERYQSAASLKADLQECLEQLLSRYYIEPFVPGQRDEQQSPIVGGMPATDALPAGQEGLAAELAHTRHLLEEEQAHRQRAEKALQASQGLFRSFVDHAPAAIFAKNCDGQYILANDRAGLAVNCTGADLIGRTAAEILPPDVAADAHHYEQQVIATGQPVTCEQYVPLPEETHTYLVTRFPLYDEHGNVYAIGGIASDITERKKAEEALQLAQFSLDHSADEILWIGEDKRFLYVNNAACRFLGYTREELLTMTIADINPVFPMETWESHWQTIKRQGFISLETSHRRKDGSIFPIEVTSTHLERGDKRYICSFVRDITERKRTEDRLRKWADIFQNIKMGVVVSDMGSDTLDMMNPAFASLYGYTVEELTGQPISAIYAPEAQQVFEQSVQQVREQDHIVFEAQHRRKDGTTFPVLVEVTVIRDRPDQMPYRIANVQDLTERKRAETRLLDQHRALTMLRERERLARELHDNLGQVLGYIKTQAQATRELLGRGEVLMADTYLAQMIAASQENQSDIREFILGATVRETLEQGFFATLEHYLQRFEHIYGITVALEVAPDLNDQVFAPATDVQLLRIIQEALTNSRKHANAQSVRVTFTNNTEHVRVVVADNGCGFEAQQATATGEDGRHFGLRSMHERAAEIGGHLRIEARSGVGTQVIVQLPHHIPRKSLSTSCRVLLVDDHPLFLQGMQNLLVGRGVEVIGTASDGREALAQARSLHPDVILMDVEMPNCNGLEATRLIKADMPEMQIVMLTMSEDEAHLFEAIKGGASGYLLKGLDTDQFFVLLTRVLEGEMVISPGLAARVLAEFASQDGAGLQSPPAPVLPAAVPVPQSTQTPPQDSPALPVELTERQVEVLSMVAQGYTYQEIGDMLHLSKHTIRYHMREVISQLHLKNRAEIIAFVQRMGLVREA